MKNNYYLLSVNTFLSRLSLLILALTFSFGLNAQSKHLRVLFLGNSYTAANNLPQWVSNIASAYGDSLSYTEITPGGQYLLNHSTDAQVVTAFQQGNWDFIVMQEQSQIPVIPYYRETLMLPGAVALRNLRNQHSTASELLFFLTWGRQAGGQQCNGPYCSYAFANFYEYQDTLTHAYQLSADSINAGISPIGEVWREVMLNHHTGLPALSLFSTDGSHPDIQGTYLAALSLYTVMFERNVAASPFVPSGISSQLDTFFRQVVDSTVWPGYQKWRLHPPQTGGLQFIEHPTDRDICTGDTLFLEVQIAQTPNVSYAWFKDTLPLSSFTSNTLLIPSADSLTAGKYYCVISDSSSSLSSDTANVVVFPSPQVKILLSDTLVFNSDTLFADAGPGYTSYLWSTGDTTQIIGYNAFDLMYLLKNIVYNKAVWIRGDLMIEVIDSNGCKGTDTILVNLIIGSVEEIHKPSLQVFPNPVKEEMRVISDSPIQRIEISGLLGQKLHEHIPENRHSAEIRLQLPSGTYMLKVHTDKGIISRPLIFQR